MARAHDDFGSTYRVPEHAPPGFANRRGGSTNGPAPIAAPVHPDDAPEGFGHRQGKDALGFTLQDCEFMYKAPDGKEHGPVPIAKILRWKQQNYFQDDVEIRPMGPWTTVGEVASRLGNAAAAPPPTTKAIPADPAPTPKAARPADRPSGSGQRRDRDQQPPQPAPPAPPPQQNDDAKSSNIAAEKLFTAGATSAEQQPFWWYIDQVNKVQGPFPASDMVSWYAAAYFDHHIKMASTPRKTDPAPHPSAFKRLGQLLSGPKPTVQQASKVIELISDEDFDAYGSPTAADAAGWGSSSTSSSRPPAAAAQGPQPQGARGGKTHSRGGGRAAAGGPAAQAAAQIAAGSAAAAAAMYGIGGFGGQQMAAGGAAGAKGSMHGQMQMLNSAQLQQLSSAQAALAMGSAQAAAGGPAAGGQKGPAARMAAQDVMQGMQGLMVAGGQDPRQAQQQQPQLPQQAQQQMMAHWGAGSWGPAAAAAAAAGKGQEQYGGWS